MIGPMQATAPNLPEIDEIVENFEFFDAWDDRFQYVIDLGKKLPALSEWPEDMLVEANRVHGCQSSVWLVLDTHAPAEGNGDAARTIDIRAVSDAHIVNGLIAILTALYHGKTPAEVLDTDAEAVFVKLGLEEHLSPTRRNGLHSMIARVRELASSHA